MQEIFSCKQMHTLAYIKIIVDELSKKKREKHGENTFPPQPT